MANVTVTGNIDFETLGLPNWPAGTASPTDFNVASPPRSLTRISFDAHGTGFAYDANNFVVGGQIASFNLALSRALPQSGPIVYQPVGSVGVTDASADAAGLQSAGLPLMDRVLGGTAAAGSDDDIRLGWASGSFFGDRSVAPAATSYRGGDDQFASEIQLSASIVAIGDAVFANPNSGVTTTGGNDNMQIGAGTASLAGDFGETNGAVVGGSDVINRWGGNAPAAVGSDSFVTGDVDKVLGGTVRGGNDTITGADGGAAGEILVGDVMVLYRGNLVGGNDTIRGMAGDDLIFGDVYLAGDGADGRPTIRGGNDVLYGGDGDDFLIGDVGYPNPAIVTGGNDVLYGGNGDDNLLGDQQNLRGEFASLSRVKGGNDKLYGGEGNDNHVGGGGDDLIDGGNGNDSVGYNQLTFDANGNPVSGGIVVQLAEGRGLGTTTGVHGNDTLISIENVLGSLGNDIIVGNSVDNTLNGSFGSDRLSGLGGNDTMFGEDGDDTLQGAAGNDRLDGGAGSNRLFGGAGNDRLTDNSATAGSFQVLNGGDGNDTITGGSRGSRSIDGGAGNDWIAFGGGDNWITTGAGSDVIAFRGGPALAANAFVEVYDFVIGADRISLRALGLTAATVDGAVEIGQWDSGAYLTVHTANGFEETVLLHGIDAANLDLHGSLFVLAA